MKGTACLGLMILLMYGTSATVNLLQTGKVSLSSTDRLTRPNFLGSLQSFITKQVMVSYPVPETGVQISTSLLSFGSYNPAIQGWNFMTNGFPFNKTTIVIGISLGGDFWSSAIVNYLCTSRQDLFVGCFIIDMDNIQYKQSAFTYSTIIPKWQQGFASKVLTTEVFLSGIRSQASSFDWTLTPNLNSNTGILSVKVELSSQDVSVQALKLCYNIVINSQDFLGPKVLQQVSLSHGMVMPGFHLLGQNTNPNAFPQITLSCIDPSCVASQVSLLQCLTVGGIVIGNVCRVCPNAASYFNIYLMFCVCGINAQLVNGKCECDPNCILTPNGCVITNVVDLKCGTGTVFNSGLKKCQCVNSQMTFVASSNTCTCPVGKTFLNGRCGCANDSFFDQSKQVCSPCIPPQFQGLDGVSCICPPNFYQVGTICIQNPVCGKNALFSRYTLNCVCVYAFAQMDSSGNCNCLTNFIPNITSKECVCDASVATINKFGTCILNDACPPPRVFDALNMKCVCLIFQQQWNGSSCVCPILKIPDSANRICVCSPGFILFQGQCLGCPNGQFINLVCVCKANFTQVRPGVCAIKPFCPRGSTYNETSKKCQCTSPALVPLSQECGCIGVTQMDQKQECVCGGIFSSADPVAKCSCVPSAVYVAGKGCQSKDSVPTAILLNAVNDGDHVCLSICVFPSTNYSTCIDCTYTLTLKMIEPTDGSYFYWTTPIPNYNGCFLGVIQGVNASKKTFVFQPRITVNGSEILSSNYVVNAQNTNLANFKFTDDSFTAPNLMTTFQTVLNHSSSLSFLTSNRN